MEIIPMTAQWVSHVAALEAACFSTPWSRESILGEVENEWSRWLVAAEGEQLLGYLGVQFGLDGGDIMTIATAPEARRQGVAKALLNSTCRWMVEKDLEWLTLEVRPSNQSALALYESMGFRQVGRRPRYYQKPTEDALLLTLFFKEVPHANSWN